jgi:ribonuclease P protein component
MLPKKYRLTKNEDFSTIYSKGFYVASDGIAIKYIRTENPTTRIGFPVGKNFSKKAVERNRARRILREACASHLKSLKSGFDIIIMPQAKNKGLEIKSSTTALGKIFKKAKLIIE